MDLSLIKKEEPAEYTLISTQEDQDLLNEKTGNNEFHSMDIYTITIKEEPSDGWNDFENANRAAAATESVHSETSEYAPESESSDESIGANDSSEDWIIGKDSSRIRSSKSNKKKRFECNKCSASFKKKISLNEHAKKHKDLSDMDCCEICNKFYPKSTIRFHVSLHYGPPYLCLICAKQFTSRDSYRGHRKIHQDKNFQCDVCQKFFISKALIRSHMEIHQEREKTFQCKICKLTFFRKNTLLRHIRNLHSNIPRMKFRCSNNFCNREYVRKEDLLKHKCQIIKLPEENLECKLCDRTFNSLRDMKLHSKRWHSEDSKHFYCKHCKKTFRALDYFVLHSAQNCPKKIRYECDLCSRLVVGKPRLISHFGNYHKIGALKTVTCSLCDKKFTNNRILVFHLRMHEKKAVINKKPTFECKYCSRIFQKESSCKHHMNKTCTYRQTFVDNCVFGKDRRRTYFECDICGQMFTEKCGIAEHLTIAHSTKSVSGKPFMKKFNCIMNRKIMQQYPCCSENYVGDAWNQQHVQKETCKFPCRKCRINFVNFYSLLRHCAEHTAKVHQSLRHLQQCKACDKIYKWKRSIPEHLQSVEDRLKCEFCHRMFKFKAHYKNHLNKCKSK